MQVVTTVLENIGVRRLGLTGKDREQAPIVFAIFLAAQVLDAVFTYGGVSRLGIDVEMNQLLAGAMRVVGPGVTLAAAKLVACLCGFFLYSTARHRALAMVAGFSIGVAVIPWCVVLVRLSLKG